MYIVTGGAGFIGSAFVAKLNQQGIYDVIVVDDLGTTEKWRNLSNKRIYDYFHKDQFLEIFAERELPWKVTALIHLGACSSTTEPDAEYVIQNNYRYSKELAVRALDRGIKLIYASSAATYGNGSCGFSDSDETTLKLTPLNSYGLSKQLFDLWALDSGAVHGMTGIKFFNVYGPNEYHKQDMRSVVLKAYLQLKEQGRISLFKSYRHGIKDGEQRRDFVYVKDCVEILWWLTQQHGGTGIYNLGSGTARTWNDLAAAVCSALDLPSAVEYIDMPEAIRDKYQYFTEADLTKLQGTGCPHTPRSLEDGVRDYVAHYLEAGSKIF